MSAKMRKRKRPSRAGEGRPARAGGVASPTMSLRLSPVERARLKALAAFLGYSEADALRRALEDMCDRHCIR